MYCHFALHSFKVPSKAGIEVWYFIEFSNHIDFTKTELISIINQHNFIIKSGITYTTLVFGITFIIFELKNYSDNNSDDENYCGLVYPCRKLHE